MFQDLLLMHLVADWILQNEWMALNKTSLNHPAAYIHSGIHLLLYMMVVPFWSIALPLAVVHLLIDTRLPLIGLRRLFHQTQEGPIMPAFSMWQDQAVHIILILLVARFLNG